MGYLTLKRKTILLRLLRTAGAAVVAWALNWLASGGLVDFIPAGNAALVVVVLTPILTALEKYLRYGSDPGEGEAAN